MTDHANMDQSIYRILDANFNRAREALRVIEEFARFRLNDAHQSVNIKQMRHALAQAVGRLNPARPEGAATIDAAAGDAAGIVAHRDITCDVGRDISTSYEQHRTDSRQVAHAACKRLGEALRVMEEYGKVASDSFGAEMEKLRYRGYEIERRLLLTVRARERFRGARLYVILTSSLCRCDWFESAQQVLAGGADVLQLREKELDDAVLLARAKKLAVLCHDRGATLIVNDRPDIALLSEADGVHVGQGDLSVAEVRRVLGGDAIVGKSTHTLEQIEAASEEAADYLAVGPMFPTSTKPQDHIAGPSTLKAARDLTSLPLMAIGGISIDDVRVLFDRGADCLCVCSEIISQADVSDATRRFRTAIDERFDVTGANHS